jgi:cysteinyl-tRNA synthetase
MSLKLYNTATRKKEDFNPLKQGKVGIYVCGVTVYDYCHIGHARVLVVFDVVYRYLKYLGYQVTYVRNITDIEDKIIKRANENGEAYNDLTERFIRAMHEDEAALGVLRPDVEPRATETIDEMLDMIEAMENKGIAYQADNGDVYFAVAKFANYGQLSGKKTAELRAGERVEVDAGKHDPLDFVLWKSAKPDEPSWPSKYGDGRPGWHIECSAMSRSLFGNHFDIHGGGQDLQFPHHENEIAQSEACNDEKFVNYWMHNGFVRVNDEKMSKSLGNFFILREVLESYRAEEIRYFIVSSHYRSQLNYSEEQLDNARAALQRLYAALQDSQLVEPPQSSDYQLRFEKALDDDFNTANAVAVLFDLARDINRARSEGDDRQHQLASLLRQLGGVLGMLQADPGEYLKSQAGQGNGLSDSAIEELVAARLQARSEKDWATADRIRGELSDAGIAIEDGNGTSRWRRA